MSEMKAISVSEYVNLLNELVAEADPKISSRPIKADVQGDGLDARAHLHIPQQHLHAAALAVFALRQKGLFCFPVLAPLDGHFLV